VPRARGARLLPQFESGGGPPQVGGARFRFCHGHRRNAPQASVDAIKQPAGSLPGKKIRVIF